MDQLNVRARGIVGTSCDGVGADGDVIGAGVPQVSVEGADGSSQMGSVEGGLQVVGADGSSQLVSVEGLVSVIRIIARLAQAMLYRIPSHCI